MRTRCPRCFYPISEDPRTAFECSSSCPEATDQVATKYEGLSSPVKMRHVSIRGPLPGSAKNRPSSLPCDQCNEPTSQEVCPICRYRLPEGWRAGVTTCIAMAGARASGKSFYIAVAIRELQSQLQGKGMPFDYATPETRTIYEDRYEMPLFKERRLIAATLPAHMDAPERAPMIFTAGQVNGQLHRLVIRDVAGEDLERGDLDQHIFSFFANADGIIFMFDPMGVEEIKALLSGLVQERRIGGDPSLVLSSLRERLAQQSRLPTSVPIAVVLSKFDVMQELRRVSGADWSHIMRQYGAAFLRDSSRTPQYEYDDQDGRLLDAEARSLLEKLGGEGVIATAGSLSTQIRFFAVSSLGQASIGDDIHPRGISPFRCLDPLKWIMSRSSVLPVA